MPSTNADNFSTTRVICTKREAGARLFGCQTVRAPHCFCYQRDEGAKDSGPESNLVINLESLGP